MMTERLRQVLRGRVRYRVREVFPDVWLERCDRAGVRIYLLEKGRGVLEFETEAADRQNVFAVSEACGAKTEVLRETGIPGFLRRRKKRIGVPVGFFLFIVIHMILSGVVWTVQVEGLETIDETRFLRYMEGAGIHPGAFSAAIDCNEAELYAGGYGERIERVSVNLIGGRIYIRVKEREPTPRLRAQNVYANVVAAKAGEVLHADVYSGMPQISQGDAVEKGQLLASGVVEKEDGQTYLTRAAARVIARTVNVVSVSTAARLSVERVGSIRKSAVPVFFLRRQERHVKKDPAEVYYNSRLLRGGNSVLPVGYTSVRRVVFETCEIEPGPEDLLLICITDHAHTVFCKLRDAEVLSHTQRIDRGNGVSIESRFVCKEDIAKERVFSLLNDM